MSLISAGSISLDSTFKDSKLLKERKFLLNLLIHIFAAGLEQKEKYYLETLVPYLLDLLYTSSSNATNNENLIQTINDGSMLIITFA